MISLYVFIEPVHAQSGLLTANTNTSPVGIPGIKVGDLPTCITVNQEKNLIYVCDSGSDTISVIDGSTNTVINTIYAGGNFPDAIALDPVTNRLYVGFRFSNTINEINTVNAHACTNGQEFKEV
jgi:YVTN family beta-propeller protein